MTSTVFLIVASVATAIFLFQFILSVFFGDLDTDAHLETDLGSVISFKGLTHFCMGMGWYIYLISSIGYSYVSNRDIDRHCICLCALVFI